MSQINVYLILLIFKLWETGDLTLWSCDPVVMGDLTL